MKERVLTFLVLASYVVFSFLVQPGYTFMAGDQVYYLGGIYKSLYGVAELGGDLSSGYLFTNYTVFDEVVVFLHTSFGMELWQVFLVLEIFFRFVMFFALYKIAYHFTGNRFFSLLAPLIFCFIRVIYGAHAFIFQLTALPRFQGLAFSMLALYFTLRGRFFISSLLFLPAVLFHPSTVIPFVVFYYLELLRKRLSLRPRRLAVLFAMPLLAFFVSVSLSTGSGFHLFSFFDDNWHALNKETNPPAFFSLWSLDYILDLLADFVLLFVAMRWLSRDLDSERKMQVVSLVLVAVGLFVAGFVSLEIVRSVFLSSLQLLRSLVLIKVLAVILFFYASLKRILENGGDYFANFALFGILVGLLIDLWSAIAISFGAMLMFFRLLKAKRVKAWSVPPEALSMALFAILVAVSFFYFWSENPTGEFFKIMLYAYAVNLVIISMLAAFILSAIIGFFWGIVKNLAAPLARNINLFMGVLIILALLQLPFFFNNFNPTGSRINPQLVDACGWINKNTGISDILLTSPYVSPDKHSLIFMLCVRPHVYPPTSGYTIFNKNYADEMLGRSYELANLDSSRAGLFFVRYKVGYVISEKELTLGNYLELAYKNKGFFIYRVVPGKSGGVNGEKS